MIPYEVFLAVSYKAACIEHSRYRLAIESIIEVVQSTGGTLYAAPMNECWGQYAPARREGIANDHLALRHCDCFVYFVDGFESDGALVELGMAIAMGKRIIILRRASERLLSHVEGLVEIGRAEGCVIQESDTPFASLRAMLTMDDAVEWDFLPVAQRSRLPA